LGNLVDRTGAGIPSEHHSDYADDEIDLRELFGVLWDGKWWIGIFTTFSFTIALIYSLSLPNIYLAEALLAPSGGDGAGMRGLAARYGGIAGLAGIALPGGGGEDKTALGLEVLESRVFLQSFIERHDLLVPLIAAKGWNSDTGELIVDASIYDGVSKKWLLPSARQPEMAPSPQASYNALSRLLSVSQDKLKGFVTVEVQHVSPIVAQQWVSWLVADLNTFMKQQDVLEAEKSIEYLSAQVGATNLRDLQAMFYELIQSQTETIMLAEVRAEYLFKTVDPAVVPEEKIGPKRSIICLIGALIGSVSGGLIMIFRHYVYRSRSGN